ncbi:hypothetical protein [Flavobacterium crassostreae]|uniref:Uncharacterized protein n=1 Tax=Flavobacterium crassostreae TaxID=1763534 RepID=A0A1B9E7N6_9FLAO|nr:hypothetical protein [Flavobacterium crassostreae]OCB77962.1 hypothetical protein LPBF_03170 [Flavobacterium crassostreae]
MKIEIENGRVFIKGKETTDPVLIGYAVLDYAEELNTNMFENKNNVQIRSKTDQTRALQKKSRGFKTK